MRHGAGREIDCRGEEYQTDCRRPSRRSAVSRLLGWKSLVRPPCPAPRARGRSMYGRASTASVCARISRAVDASSLLRRLADQAAWSHGHNRPIPARPHRGQCSRPSPRTLARPKRRRQPMGFEIYLPGNITNPYTARRGPLRMDSAGQGECGPGVAVRAVFDALKDGSGGVGGNEVDVVGAIDAGTDRGQVGHVVH